MKFLFLAFFILMANICCAQAKIDTGLSGYIINHQYLLLSDTAKLPRSMNAYYPEIIAFLSKYQRMQPDSLYLDVRHIHDTPTLLTVALLHISGIRVQQKFDRVNAAGKNKPDTMMFQGRKTVFYRISAISGNASGVDGELKADKVNKIISFSLFQ